MINRITSQFDFNAEALKLRSERQRVIASNIANADTPGFQARDFDFKAALSAATRNLQGSAPQSGAMAMAVSDRAHLGTWRSRDTATAGLPVPLQYRQPLQAAFDTNTVEIDHETASFAENAIRYEAALPN